MHIYAILKKKNHAKAAISSCSSYAPIAKALCTLPDLEKSYLRVKFSTLLWGKRCHSYATWAWGYRHSVSACTNTVAGKNFCRYIAKSKLSGTLPRVKFFPFSWMGRQTVATLTMNWSWQFTVIPMVVMRRFTRNTTYMYLPLPSSVTAAGCTNAWAVLFYMYRSWCSWYQCCTKLVGNGTDEALSNIA